MTALAVGAGDPTLASFGHDPWWLICLKVLAIFLFLLLGTLLMIWAERRVIGRMQQRPGPNRAGKFGLLQSLMDGIKLPPKEDIIPRGVDRLLFVIAPAIAAIPALISFSIIPFGPIVLIFHHHTPLQLADLPVAVLLVLAMSSIGVYGIVLAGWASSSPYSLLGGLRSCAQVISYEIAMGLSFVPVFMYAGSLSTTAIVAAQAHGVPFRLGGVVLHYPSWFAVLLLPSFVIYLITMVGETNRLPFDLPEGEGELVAGYHTEYSSLKFALFYLAEYVNMITVSGLATTLFLGGWRAPWPITVWSGANSGWYPLLWFLGKIVILLFCFIWLRGSLPRIRYDQLMRLGWKVLIPVALAWMLIIATFRVYRRQDGSVAVYLVAGGIIVVLMLLAWSWRRAAQRKAASAQALAKAESIEPGGEHVFPVPPMDLPHYHGVGLAEEGSPSKAEEVADLADGTAVTIPLTTSAACGTFPAMAEKGIKFAYENAVRQSSVVLDAMASLDTKVAVIIAALLVGTGVLFHPSQPTWVRAVIAVLLTAALITSSRALAVGAKQDVAPSPEAVGRWIETMGAEDLESLFLTDVIAAFDNDFIRYKRKAFWYRLSLSIVALGVIFVGSVRLAGVF